MRNYKCIAYDELQKDKKVLKIKRLLQGLAIFGMAIVIGINA